MLKKLLTPFASLKLTIVLLSLSFVLVFVGTWAQRDMGIVQVQKTYFHSLFVVMEMKHFRPPDVAPGEAVSALRNVWAGITNFLKVPFPGGYTLGLLLLVNLLAAHAVRFRFTWKDLILIPQLGLVIPLFYYWQFTGNGWLLAAGLSVGVLMVGSLALIHAKRTGVILIHLGLILLIVGEAITSVFQVESQMRIDEGDSSIYSTDFREVELVIASPAEPGMETVVAVGQPLLRERTVVRDGRLPFSVRIDDFQPNSTLRAASAAGPAAEGRATGNTGPLRGVVAVEQKLLSGVGDDAKSADMPSVYVTIDPDGVNRALLLTSHMDWREPVTVGGKTYEVGLRFRRHYRPYTVKLIEFRADRYTGTDVPRNYSSLVRLIDPARNVDREVLIRMNEPLRYRGDTLYQSGFDGQRDPATGQVIPGTERTTILQVVNNPGLVMPYFACVIGGLGLIIHFGILLIGFIRRSDARAAQWAQSRPPPPPPARRAKAGASYTLEPRSRWRSADVLVPALVVLIGATWAASKLRPPAAADSAADFDLASFGRLPVSYQGRIQPLDSLARTSMRTLAGKESPRADEGEKKLEPIKFLADLMAHHPRAADYPVFRIDHPDVKSALGLPDALKDRKYLSYRDLFGTEAREKAFREQVQRIPPKSDDRDAFQAAMASLASKRRTFDMLYDRTTLHLLAPLAAGQEEWLSEWTWQSAPMLRGRPHPSAEAMQGILAAYYTPGEPQAGGMATTPPTRSSALFNERVAAYHATLAAAPASAVPMRKVAFEAFNNRFDPLYTSLFLYVGVFVLAALSWLGWSNPLRRGAVALLVFTLVLHTLGLLFRMYITGRPPVTNLASSAIFIGWGAALLALGVEWFYKNALGAAVAGLAGFLGLLIYVFLAMGGDSMAVLVAVLDTNFWLATHVLAITLGYAATFLAGLFGMAYLIGGLYTFALDDARRKALARMIYGTTCFAILFSFTGTVLGGIWADQSWGRFWGWDPKENGAVLIVIANAILLHARWAGLVKERGLAMLALFGNMTTSWSWFGTNMMGVGLHSYGFMESAMWWLILFNLSQLALILAAGFTPLSRWLSFRDEFASHAQRGFSVR